MEFEAIIGQIIDLMERIRAKIEWIAQRINALLSQIPDALAWVADEFRQGWDLAMEKLDELWTWFLDKLSYAGVPWELWGAASAWVENVGGPVSNINETIYDVNLSVDDEWVGKAASQYKQGIQPQRDAVQSIFADFSEKFSGAMNKMAWAIVVFWAAVASGLAVLLLAIVAAVAEVVSILGIPIVPPTITAGIVSFLSGCATGVTALFAAKFLAKSDLESTTVGLRSWPRAAI